MDPTSNWLNGAQQRRAADVVAMRQGGILFPWNWPAALMPGYYFYRRGLWQGLLRALWSTRWTLGLLIFAVTWSLALLVGGKPGLAWGPLVFLLVPYLMLFCGTKFNEIRYVLTGDPPEGGFNRTLLTPELAGLDPQQQTRAAEAEAMVERVELFPWSWEAALMTGFWAWKEGIGEAYAALFWRNRMAWLTVAIGALLGGLWLGAAGGGPMFVLMTLAAAPWVAAIYLSIASGMYAHRMLFVLRGDPPPAATAPADPSPWRRVQRLLIWAAVYLVVVRAAAVGTVLTVLGPLFRLGAQ